MHILFNYYEVFSDKTIIKLLNKNTIFKKRFSLAITSKHKEYYAILLQFIPSKIPGIGRTLNALWRNYLSPWIFDRSLRHCFRALENLTLTKGKRTLQIAKPLGKKSNKVPAQKQQGNY